MQAVIDRLKASKVEAEEKEALFGKQIGTEWAEEHADYQELQRLEKYASEVCQSCYDGDEIAHAVSRGLYDFWEFVFFGYEMEGEPTEAEIRGFVNAALDVWLSVRGQLN